MDSTNQELYDKLEIFLREAMPISENSVNKPERFAKYYDVESKDGKERIVSKNERNWKNLDVIGDESKIRSLKSYIDAFEICKIIPQISNHNDQTVFAFNIGYNFSIIDIPIQFLRTLIFLERGYTFRQVRFENIFSDFLTFISDEHYSKAKVIVPLAGIDFSEKCVLLDDNLRIRKLNTYEISEFLNLYPYRESAYLLSSDYWQKNFFEFEIKIEWTWFDRLKSHEYNKIDADKHLHSQDFSNVICNKINQEIIILRALTNRTVSGEPFEIIYTGWFSPNTGGSGDYSPWNRPRETAQLSSKNICDYQENRQIFLSIKNKKHKQQIFFAMRKLALSMDQIYSGDEVFDTISGLEGLLVNSNVEVSHKFAERAALLLESDPDKRIELQKNLRHAYDLRSKVAHGASVIDDKDSIISKRFSGQIADSQKEYATFNKNQKLKDIARDSLHRTIVACVRHNNTEFNWDSALMGKELMPADNNQ